MLEDAHNSCQPVVATTQSVAPQSKRCQAAEMDKIVNNFWDVRAPPNGITIPQWDGLQQHQDHDPTESHGHREVERNSKSVGNIAIARRASRVGTKPLGGNHAGRADGCNGDKPVPSVIALPVDRLESCIRLAH